MSTGNPTPLQAMRRRAEELGYRQSHSAILQKAQVFLELSGESLRSSLITTNDGHGNEWCLRPEFTIPTVQEAIKTQSYGRFVCAGPVFRMEEGNPHEFLQLGLEDLGDPNTHQADNHLVASLLELLPAKARSGVLLTGEASLIPTVVDQLDLPPSWVRRWRRRLSSDRDLRSALKRLEQPTNKRMESMSRLQGLSKEEAKALIKDLMALAGLTPVGTRSVSEIADRFFEQQTETLSHAQSERAKDVLESLLSIETPLESAAEHITKTARVWGLNLDTVAERLDARHKNLNKTHQDIVFSSSFDRAIDYYTGLMFELRTPSHPRPIAAGGRYDRLATLLGAQQAIPAVGGVIWLDRLEKQS